MIPYEFRTVSHGKTLWTVEHYFLSDLEALNEAAKSGRQFEIRVWRNGHLITRHS